MENTLERQTLLKVWWRVVPLASAILFLSFLNRGAIGFAALQMNEDLQFSNTVFGTGAGCFAIGYALFCIPGTVLLHRVGARRWLSALVIVWALCSASTALVTRAEELFVVRLLLGAAEATFAPGVMLYFTYWFPSAYRGRVLGTLMFINPLSMAIGGPIAGAVLSADGAFGLAGWQWLFIVEALPATALGVAVFVWLPDKPSVATWLSPAEKIRLKEQLEREKPRVEQGNKGPAGNWLAQGPVWTLALIHLAIGTSGIGTLFFLPMMIQSMGFSIGNTGLLAALPAIAAALALPVWGIWVDRSPSREAIVAAGCFALGGGLLAAALLLPSAWALLPICVAMVGLFGALVAFWSLPPAVLSGTSVAAGMAFITIMGNLGTFFGPTVLGWLSDVTTSFAAGLTLLAAAALSAALTMLFSAKRKPTFEPVLPPPNSAAK